jgi:hypothetical protein
MDVKRPDLRRLMQTFVIELIVYGVLLAALLPDCAALSGTAANAPF